MPASTEKASVVLLHGMARSSRSMNKMAKALTSEGYWVLNVDYPSTKFCIADLANQFLAQTVTQCPPDQPIHFVTHSLGGIVLRQYLSEHKLPQLGRIVMLGPPNQGSEVVDKLKHFPGYQWINGPAGMQLGTEAVSTPNSLAAADFPLGVIAGNKSINLILSMMIPGADDGKVSVARSKLKGMRDHLVLPVSHPFLMRNDAVIEQVKCFLKTSKFRVK